MNITFTRWMAAATAIGMLLSACGGGGSGGSGSTAASTTTATKQVASGTVTGFGSVIVDGNRFDDSGASVSIEFDSSAPKSGALTEIKLGMQVEVQSDDGLRAGRISVSPEIVGRISSLAADGFVVLGQTVKISADVNNSTTFEGVASLAGLAVGDVVEVHGQRDASNNLVATRIERKSASSVAFVRVVGTVAGLNAGATSFTLGTLTVNVDASTKVLPTGTTLANGQRVAVYSTGATGNALTARSIVVRKTALQDGQTGKIGGLITGLDFAARTFNLGAFKIDASSATFGNGTAADLANGRPVRVQGTLNGGVVTATSVAFLKNKGDAKVELTGAITDFVSSASFKVRGVPVDASGAGIEFKNGDATNLADGVMVKIEGAVSNNVVTPTQVSFVQSQDGSVRAAAGLVTGYNAATGSFTLFNMTMKLLDTATFVNADGTTAAQADFANGRRVLVRGAFASGTFNVSAVTFIGAASAVVRTEGVVYDLDATAGTFKVNGTAVSYGSGTSFDDSGSGTLANGALVEVEGTVSGATLVASRIQVKSLDSLTVAEAKGQVTEFASLASFRVAGQLVDASSAVFTRGSAVNVVDGALVEVRGAVTSGGVLKATTIKIDNN